MLPAVLLGLTVAAGAGARAGATLVVDNTFTIITADPQRSFEPTATMVERAVYDTLLTYDRGEVARPTPLLARSYANSNGARTWTFQLRRDVRFADGTPLTAADVVFSFRRLKNLEARPSFLLRRATVTAKGPYTVVIRTATPVVAMPQIVANTSLAVLNSRLARRHGATDAATAHKTDKAERWLNSGASAGVGSGPYVLKTYSTSSQITLVPNDRYWGPSKPRWRSIVIRNLPAAAQLLNVRRGRHEIALDLSGSDARSIRGEKRLHVSLQRSAWVFLLFTNNDPNVSAITANRHFQSAVRYSLDYRSIVGVAGPGAIQAPGIIPSPILGALPQSARVSRDAARAAFELAASGLGSPVVTLEYPSDVTLNGVPFSTIAQKVQANLADVGIHVNLAGSPLTLWLSRYVTGKMAFGLAARQVDYPDPLNFLAFMPGELVGARVGWPAGADPPLEALAAAARRTVGDTARAGVFRKIQLELNRRGPFFPLVQPAQAFVATADIAGAAFNVVYQVDVTRTAPRE
jgi:peptide/nickel transport system substrate-binding protein